MKQKLLLASAAISPLIFAPVFADEVQPIGTGRPDHQLIYEVIQEGLSALGDQSEEMLTGAYPAIHLSLSQGDADYTAVHWVPLHNDYYNNSGGEDVFVRAGPTYTDAMQGYFIDKATADAHGITDLAQMQDPEIAAIFDTDGDGLANLTGCNPGWGCEAVIEHHLDAYELRDHINNDKGEYFALMANTIERFEADQPIFYTAWAPNWINSVLVPGEDVVFLNAPFSSLPGNENADTEWEDGRNPGFGANDNYILINRDFAEANPAAATFLDGLRLPISDLNAMMARINAGEDSASDIRAIAHDWIVTNQDSFDSLIVNAQAAAN
ncbi:glycine betaine/L-proline ABC transporter substrate-binding protein ProX [Cochlodiniinecator piscidefendens]|uniref:glycine betaine/L-proline ABC transporter substrate-binding protein ProX n=1 Tax=Cochlodiniinecator piscidefendens TaxID=2715756 RepID=UPI00140D69D8|nr:glycine betaine/L-proline ABC transporter substrate-binding protein ProX [Cochlodiniinecator piscidefendens]